MCVCVCLSVCACVYNPFICKLSVHLSWAVESTDCISANPLYLTDECPGYDTKPSDGECPLLKL